MESELQATDNLAIGIGRGLEEGLKILTNMHLVLRDEHGNIKKSESTRLSKGEGVDGVNTFGFGSGRRWVGPGRIPHVSAASQYLQGRECSSSPISGTANPLVRGGFCFKLWALRPHRSLRLFSEPAGPSRRPPPLPRWRGPQPRHLPSLRTAMAPWTAAARSRGSRQQRGRVSSAFGTGGWCRWPIKEPGTVRRLARRVHRGVGVGTRRASHLSSS
jgi:hypothetical protein